MRIALVAALASCGGASSPPLLVAGQAAPAEWVRQWRSAASYHGTFTLTTPTATYAGTIASDPAHRLLRVQVHQSFGPGAYERDVEVVADGKRARLTGKGGGSSHVTLATLPADAPPDAPFGDLVSAVLVFSHGADLRQTVLDCLEGTTLVAAGAHEWKVTRAPELALAQMIARKDSSLVAFDGKRAGKPYDHCNGATLLSAPDGTLLGLRERPVDGVAATLTFQVFAGAPELAGIDVGSPAGASNLDGPIAETRRAVEAVVADPQRRAELLAKLAAE